MLIIHKVNTKESFEISWIYDRGSDGLFLKISDAKGKLNSGDKVSLSHYSPKLGKKIESSIVLVETNEFNSDICITLKNRRDIAYFKKTLCQAN